MALRRHNVQWQNVYTNAGSNVGGAIRAGGSSGLNTLLGFNSSAILNDIKTSKVRAKVWLKIQVTDAGTFDLGMHRSTNSKTTSGIPYYTWTGRSFIPNTGLAEYDITTFNRSIANSNDKFEGALENGYHGPVLYGSPGSNLAQASSVYIEIEGVWNEAPTAGEVLYPEGGETLNGVITLRAAAGTDPDGDNLTYQFGLRDADGYKHFPRQTGLTRNVNLNDYKEASNAKVSVRAWDGQSYSPWKYSPIFTIRHNIPPKQPTLIEPLGGSIQDKNNTILFRWKHNDSDGQSAYNFRLRPKGTTEWQNARRITSQEYRAIRDPVMPFGEIEWQVQTEDQGGLLSPWSDIGVYRSTEPSSRPTILKPANNEIVSTETVDIGWSSSDQKRYNVQILSGSNIFWEIERASGNKAVTVGENLQNNTIYTVRVRVMQSGGLWSDWDETQFETSFVPPTQPEFTITADNELSRLIIDITNPLPSGLEPDIAYNSIYRREAGKEWMLIGDIILENGTFIDYTLASKKTYEYMVTAHGDNKVTMDSVPAIGSILITGTIISLASDPTNSVLLTKVISRNLGINFEAKTSLYNGRESPVTDFGEVTQRDIPMSFKVTTEQYEEVYDIIAAKETLLYRDKRGKKLFVTCSGLSVTELLPEDYEVNLTLNEVDYKEDLSYG